MATGGWGQTCVEWYVAKELVVAGAGQKYSLCQGQWVTAIRSQTWGCREIQERVFFFGFCQKREQSMPVDYHLWSCQTHFPMNQVNELSELEKFSTFRVELKKIENMGSQLKENTEVAPEMGFT